MNRPAVIAGWVGVGVAVVVVLSFALVLAVQGLVFLLALPVGLLMGWYAIERRRAARAAEAGPGAPGARVGLARALGDGLVAGLMTAVALALFYVLVRLLFLYLDNGFRAGGPPYACSPGPGCAYERALDEPAIRSALEEAGVRDAAGYTAFFLEGQAVGGATLVVLVLAGSLAGSAVHGLRSPGARASTIAPGAPR